MLSQLVLGFLTFCVSIWGERSWFCALLNALKEEKALSDKLFQRGFLLVPLNVRFHILTAFLLTSFLCVDFGFCHLLIFRVEFEVNIPLLTMILVELQTVTVMVIDRSLDR